MILMKENNLSGIPKTNIFDAENPDFSEYVKYLEQNIVASKEWVFLCHDKANQLYWQLDIWDKYQRRLAIRLLSPDDFPLTFEQRKKIGMEFLEKSMGIGTDKCQWQNCKNSTINGLAFCSFHAYTEMGVR